MSGPPGHPPFDAYYEPSFSEDRATLGLSGRNFDHFFQDVERVLADYPREGSTAVPGGEGVLILPTRDVALDIPPLYVYYRVEERPNRIRYLGLSHAWSEAETFDS